MKKNILDSGPVAVALVLVLMWLLIIVQVAFAEQSNARSPIVHGSTGGSQGVASGTRDQVQEQVQERDQVQLQTYASAIASGTPLRTREQSQTNTQTQEGSSGLNTQTPLENQERNRVENQNQVHATSVLQLRQMIQEQNRIQVEEGIGTGTGQRAQVTAQAFQSAELMLGPNGPKMSELAKQVQEQVQAMEQNELKLQERSWFKLMFFGHNQDVVDELHNVSESNRERIQEMQQLLNSCDQDCDQEVKLLLQERVREMEQEQDRIREVTDEAKESRGLFGFLFGWLGD